MLQGNKVFEGHRWGFEDQGVMPGGGGQEPRAHGVKGRPGRVLGFWAPPAHTHKV